MAPQKPSDDQQSASRGSRAVGCFSILLMVAAVPALLVGILIHMISSDSAEANSGVGGALSGLGEVVGAGVIVAAALTLLIGALLYIRSAPKR